METKTIVGGPSSEGLFLALRLQTERRTVEFTESDERTIVARITSISAEDGSGSNWLLSGYTVNGSKFTGYFNTQRRAGWLQFPEPLPEFSREYVDGRNVAYYVEGHGDVVINFITGEVVSGGPLTPRVQKLLTADLMIINPKFGGLE